jgi:EmrB/QacA subfamily drug resistance transporter
VGCAVSVVWGTPQARGVLAATIAGAGLAMLDSTIVNVALPAIGASLDASIADLQWILNGYLLSLAALVLVAGSLGDTYGRRRVFLVGVVWFGLASMLCGLAWNTEALIAARILQGVGGALLTPGSLAILQAAFVPSDRGKAIGAWSGLSGVASAIGPLVGGLLVQAGSWRLAFGVNLPVTALCVWLTLRYVPESRDPHSTPPAWGVAALGAVGLAGVTAALVEAPGAGITHPMVLGAAAVGIGALAGFVVTARGRVVPSELFADRTFVLANAYTFLIYGVLGGVFVLLVVQLQTSLGYTPTQAGLASLPITAIMLALSSRSGQLAQRIGPRAQLVAGPLLMAAALLLMRRIEPGGGYLDTVLPPVAVFGLGLATMVAPITATALAAALDEHVGVASGVNNAIARTGSLLAVAVLPAVAGLQGSEYADPSALTDGWRSALLVAAAVTVSAAALAAGIDNRVLVQPQCAHCGVDAPPTYASVTSQSR